MFMVNLTAKDIMTAPVLTVKETMSIEEVSDFFVDKMITGAPVVDENDKPIGVVTLTDIARNEPRREHIVSDKINNDFIMRDWEGFSNEETTGYHLEESDTLTVRDIMTPFIYKVEADTPLKQLASIMLSGRIHRLFVTRKEQIIGIVSALDMLKTFMAERANKSNYINDEHQL